MKTTLLTLGASSLLFLSASCLTFVPVDPNTGNPGCNMMPDKQANCCTKQCEPCCVSHSKGEVKPTK